MPGHPAYRSYRVRMRAVIDGADFDVVQFGCSYELNAIPTATLLVPVGREAKSLAPAKIHAAVARMKMRLPATVYLELRPLAEANPDGIEMPDLGIPEDGCEFKIFEGFTSGAGYRKVRGRARFEISLHHWLIQMSDSSTLSYESHPLNPSEFTYGALMPGTSTGAKHWTGLTQADEFITAANIQSDFWHEALRPLFANLLEGNLLQFAARGGTVKGTSANSGALAALQRFAEPGDDCYAGLSLDGNLNTHIVQQIRNASASLLKNPDFMAHHTLWDVLVGKMCPEYLFSLVPRVDDALVVPFIPGLRTHGAEINAKEYAATSLNATTPRPLRAVGVQSATVTRTGLDMYDDDAVPPPKLGVGGWYEGREDGTIQIKQGPGWLSRLVVPMNVSRQATGGVGSTQSSIFDPDAGSNVPDRTQTTTFANDVADLLDRYAQSLYAIETIKGRQGTLSGPLRFDISPGTTVRVEGASEAFIPGDQLGVPYFASVLRVTFAVDAEGAAAGCSYHLAHIRNDAENSDDNTSVDRHPLWNTEYTGCVLTECPPKEEDDSQLPPLPDPDILPDTDDDGEDTNPYRDRLPPPEPEGIGPPDDDDFFELLFNEHFDCTSDPLPPPIKVRMKKLPKPVAEALLRGCRELEEILAALAAHGV